MAKKASLVDKALEVSRKVRVPKKPVKTKGKKTVPAVLDWGTGIPEDKLAYLNDDEMALVQANRMFKGKRSHKGVPAFPDPKDTGAGENSRLPGGGGGAGTGGRPGGGGSGGQPGPGGSSSGSASKGATSGAGGQSGASQSKDQSKPSSPSAPSGGPSGGPTSAPARTEPSRGATPPSSFGPRSGGMPGTPVSTAPSTAAYEGALSRIAQGSSVIGNPSGQKQFTDRVPQAQSPTVNFSQNPMAGPNRGLGGISQPKEDLTLGANSPFASPGLAGYNRETYNPSTAPTAPSGLLGPSVPVGTAGYTKEQQAARFPGAAAYNNAVNPVTEVNVPAPSLTRSMPAMPSPAFAATDPRVAQTPAGAYPAATPMDPSFPGRIADAKTLGEQLAFASGAAANKIGSYIGSAAQNVGDYASSLFGGEPSTQTAATKTPAQEAAELQNRINQNRTATKTPAQEAAELQNQINQNRVAAVTGINPQTGLPYGEKMQDRISASYNPADVSINPQTGLPFGEKIQDRLPGYGTPAPVSPATEALALEQTIDENRIKAERDFINSIGENVYGDPLSSLVSSSPPGKTRGVTFSEDIPEPLSIPPSEVQNPVVMNTPYGPVTQLQLDRMIPSDQQKLRDWAQNYAATATSVMNKSPAEQAMDVRRAVALAQGPAQAPGSNAPTPASVKSETPQYAYNDVPFSQGDYLPSQAPAYDVSPSQQSGLTDAQREAYLDSIMGGRSGGGILANVNGPMMAAPAGVPGAKKDKKYLPPMPPWQDYDYLYTDYPEIAYAPDQRIIDFNNYNATFKKGGRVGDSVDAALRLARHSIVSRPKTR